MRKQGGLSHAQAAVKVCLQALSVVAVDRLALELAADWPGADFEDNLQIACAVLSGLDAIVTRDPKGFAGSPVAVLSPAECLGRLANSS